MPIRPQLNSPGTRLAAKVGKQMADERAYNEAYAEEGSPSVFQRRLEERVPINQLYADTRAAKSPMDRLAALAGFLNLANTGRGIAGSGTPPGPGKGLLASMPEDAVAQQLLKFKGIARRMGLGSQDLEDAQQAGAEGALKAKPEMNPNVAAKRAIQNDLRNQVPHGDRASADYKNIQKVVSDYEQEVGRPAGSADDFAIYHRFRNTLSDPEAKKAWTPSKFLDVKNSAPRAGALSLDDVVGRTGEEEPLHGLVAAKGEPSPEVWAEFAQRKSRLTNAQQGNLEKLIEGTNVNPAIKARILAKMRETPETKPISGGSAADMNAEEYISRLRAERERVQGGGNPTRFEGSETPLPTDAKPRIYESDSRPSRGPATLFHATPAGPGIRDTGMLEGRTGTTHGGLGGSGKPGVSTTTNLDDAMESARLMQRTGWASRNGMTDPLMDEMILTDLARAGHAASPENLAAVRARMAAGSGPYSPPPGAPANSQAVESIRNYMGTRNAHLDPFDEQPGQVAFPRDPYMVMPDEDPGQYARKMSSLQKVTPEGIRVAKIPQDAIPPKAMVTGGADPGEIQVMSDIPGRLIQLLKPALGSMLGFAGLNSLRNQQPQEAQQ